MHEDFSSVEHLLEATRLSDRQVRLARLPRRLPEEIATPSPRTGARPQTGTISLETAGHDVPALAVDRTFAGLDDPLVLALAAAEHRVLVTRNSRDFARRAPANGPKRHATTPV